MNYFQKFFGHLKTVIIHKFWVCYYCHKCGLVWRGLKHDMSKFSPVEFFESVKYYTGTHSPIDDCKKDKGYSKAWQHHKGRNTHHYEYWQDNFDKGTTHLCMPYKDTIEMLCDYLGAGRAYMGKNFSYSAEYKWWLKKLSDTPTLAINDVQKYFITIYLYRMAKHNELFSKKELPKIWNFVLYSTQDTNK